MHQRSVSVDPPPAVDATLVARLRLALASREFPAEVPFDLADVARLLGVDPQHALSVAMEVGRDGFLRRDDQRTLCVLPQGATRLDELLALRLRVEPWAVREVAGYVRPADMIGFRHLVSSIEEALEARDDLAIERLSAELHAAILSLHPSAHVLRVCTDLRARTPRDGLRAAIREGVDAAPLHWLGALMDALEAADGETAEALVVEHLERARFFGTPQMDAPYLVAPALELDEGVELEFLDAE